MRSRIDSSRRAITLATGKVALFLQLRMLEGIERHRTIYALHPPSRVWVFTHRLGMDKGGNGDRYRSGMIANMWVTWELPTDPARKPALGWLSCRQGAP